MCIGGGGGGSTPPAATPVAPAPAPVTIARLGRSASRKRRQERSGGKRNTTRSGLTIAKTGIQYSGSGQTGVNA
jgi:hypothetical protein